MYLCLDSYYKIHTSTYIYIYIQIYAYIIHPNLYDKTYKCIDTLDTYLVEQNKKKTTKIK